MISIFIKGVEKSRKNTTALFKSISQMRLSVINEYVPIQRRPFIGLNWFTFVNLSAGNRNMGTHRVYGQITLFGYGFQLWSKR